MTTPCTSTEPSSTDLDQQTADTYATWFGSLADGTRVRILHAVATSADGLRIGEIAEAVGVAQPTASHHVKLLAAAGFVLLSKEGTATVVRVNEACCTGLPHAADAVMGTLERPPAVPTVDTSAVQIRAMNEHDAEVVRDIYLEGIATRMATFATEAPPADELLSRWLSEHRWIAEADGRVAGWASLSPVSTRDCYRGVAETQVYVSEASRGKRVGHALLNHLVAAADDAGLWTLQAQIFSNNRASIRLHHTHGFRTVGVRERIAQLDGVWRDTVLLERR